MYILLFVLLLLPIVTALDSDQDGISDDLEQKYGSDPHDKDSDNDLLNDGLEINSYKTNTLHADSDEDGLTDYEESMTYGTNPLLKDTDGDLISDGQEVTVYFTNSHSQDSNMDGLTDYEEIFVYFTDPNDIDTDNDGLYDFYEVRSNLNPRESDTDHDGLKDGEEKFLFQSNPMQADTDNDGISDFKEVLLYRTDPTNKDTDNDGVSDYEEIGTYFTSPISSDMTKTVGSENAKTTQIKPTSPIDSTTPLKQKQEIDDKKSVTTKKEGNVELIDADTLSVDEQKKIYGSLDGLKSLSDINTKDSLPLEQERPSILKIIHGTDSPSGAITYGETISPLIQNIHLGQEETQTVKDFFNTDISFLILFFLASIFSLVFLSFYYRRIKKNQILNRTEKNQPKKREKMDWEFEFEK